MGLSHAISDDEVIEYFNKGLSVADISRKLNTTYETVKYRLIRNRLLVYRNGHYVRNTQRNARKECLK